MVRFCIYTCTNFMTEYFSIECHILHFNLYLWLVCYFYAIFRMRDNGGEWRDFVFVHVV